MTISKFNCIWLSGLLLLAGCSLPQPENDKPALKPESPGMADQSLFLQGKITNPVFADNVRDITKLLRSGAITCTADQTVFTWTTNIAEPSPEEGDILYAAMDGNALPLARKITGLASGEGVLTIKTCAAELFELYKSYSFSLHKELGFSDLEQGQSSAAGTDRVAVQPGRSSGQQYSNQLSYTLDDVLIGKYPYVRVNGVVTLYPSVDINWQIVNNQLVSLHFVTSASFESDVTFRFGLTGELNYEKALVGASFTPVETPVGTFTPKLGIMLGIEGSLDASISVGGRFSGNVTGGCQYAGSRWSPIGDCDVNADLYKDDCMVNFEGDVKAYFGPRANLEYQSVTGNCLGFYADMLSFLEAECDNLVFKFYQGSLVEAGVKESLFAKILGKSMPDIKYTVVDERHLIDTLDMSGGNTDEPLQMYLSYVYNDNNHHNNPPGFYTLDPPLHLPNDKDLVVPYNWDGIPLRKYRVKLKNTGNTSVKILSVVQTCIPPERNSSMAFRCSFAMGSDLSPCSDNEYITIYTNPHAYFWPKVLTYTVTLTYQISGVSGTKTLSRRIIVESGNAYKESFPRTDPFKADNHPIAAPSVIPEPFPTPSIAALAPPASVNATDNLYGKKITITWPDVKNATHYKVYKMNFVSGTSPAWDYLYSPLTGWITTTTFTDTQVAAGNKYGYRIKAAGDTNGYRESALSPYDLGMFMLESKLWYATDGCNRLDVWADVWYMGQNPHWGQIRVYNTDNNAFLGLLSDFDTLNPLCNLYYGGSSAWPGSTYRFHNSYTQFRQKGLPRYIKANFFNNTLAFCYSDMSNSLDLNTGRKNLAHRKPIILHDGNVGEPYARANDWVDMNDGDWQTDWLTWTNYNDTIGTKAVIDLGSICTIGSYRYRVYWDSHYGTTAQIQLKVSTDNATWQTISDRVVGNRQLIDASITTKQARYVRMEWVKGSNPWNGWGGINELEVYGY